MNNEVKEDSKLINKRVGATLYLFIKNLNRENYFRYKKLPKLSALGVSYIYFLFR